MNTGKICVSVCAETADEMIAKIKRAEEFADLVEVRFDCLDREQIEKCLSEISNLKFEKPLVATYRSPEQGGNGTASFDDRIAFWQKNSGEFWAVDLEEDVLGAVIKSTKSSLSISSYHDFYGVPENLSDVIERLFSSSSDVVKIAVQADDIPDTLAVWDLLEKARKVEKSSIPIAMGEAGKWTRILGLAHGAFLTYASIECGGETASGQLTARDLIETYRVKQLNLDTKVYGIIGNPVSRSLSAAMLNPAFADAGINAIYIPFLVKNLDEFIRRMVNPATREVELNFGGFSVTMPHKETIIKHLDTIDPVAEKIGAVNTLMIGEGGKLYGYNTDSYGFITPLKKKYGDLNDARVAVFGVGGSARACVYALKQENAFVTVFSRDLTKAERFAAEFGIEAVEISNYKSAISNVSPNAFDIVVNTTPLGMEGQFANASILTAEQLKGVKLVYDLVTKSSDTPLIAEAKKAGVATIGGVEMLIAQGEKQFQIWTGRTAHAGILKRSAFAAMQKQK